MSAKDASMAARQNQLAALIADVFAPPMTSTAAADPTHTTAVGSKKNTSAPGKKKTCSSCARRDGGQVSQPSATATSDSVPSTSTSPSKRSDRDADFVFKVQATLDECDDVSDAKAALAALCARNDRGPEGEAIPTMVDDDEDAEDDEEEEEGTEILDLTLEQLQELRALEEVQEAAEAEEADSPRDAIAATTGSAQDSPMAPSPPPSSAPGVESQSPHRPKVESSPMSIANRYADDPTLRILPRSNDSSPGNSPSKSGGGEKQNGTATATTGKPTSKIVVLTWDCDGDLWWTCETCRTDNVLDDEVRARHFPSKKAKDAVETVDLPLDLPASALLPTSATTTTATTSSSSNVDASLSTKHELAKMLKCYICESRPTPVHA